MKRESDLLRTVLDWLKLYKVFHWRQNVIGVKKGSHYIRAGFKGMPDIFALHRGDCYALELKSDDGQQTAEQKIFQSYFEAARGIYVLVRRLEDVSDLWGAEMTMNDPEDYRKKRKRFLKFELERLNQIPDTDVLPEVLPFVRMYKRNVENELQRLKGEDDATRF